MLAWVPRGGEIIAGESSHTLAGEAGGYAVLVGASARSVARGPDGMLPPAAIAEAFRDPIQDVHDPISSMVTIENTYNAAGGLPLRVAYTEAVAAVAHERGVPLHLDGARLFNAVVALGVPAAELCRPVDSVMVALSKGLACPVGSIVAGSAEFVGARAAGPEAGRRRDAPGGDHRRGRGRRTALRPRRHDRPDGRGPRERAPPGRGPGDAAVHLCGSGAGPDELRDVPASRRLRRGAPPRRAIAVRRGARPLGVRTFAHVDGRSAR